jgi:hypothetical protein
MGGSGQARTQRIDEVDPGPRSKNRTGSLVRRPPWPAFFIPTELHSAKGFSVERG